MWRLSIVDGTSVLSRFTNLLEAWSYIQVAYLEYRDTQQSRFQVEILNIDINRSSSLSILLHNQSFCGG